MELNATPPNKDAMNCLNQIFQAEMAGIVRYLHYSFMIVGPNRIPIQKWFRDQATEASQHAIIVGEQITSYGGHPPVVSAHVEETNQHSVQALLEESLKFELETLDLYKKLVKFADADMGLEELARDLLRQETDHVNEVRKMLRKP